MNPLIKRKLPPAPRPTRAYQSSNFITYLDGSVVRKAPKQTLTVAHVPPEAQKKAAEKGHAVRSKQSAEKYRIIVEMAKRNCSDEEIAEAVGYQVKSVAGVIGKLRKRGEDIQPRKKRPCNRRNDGELDADFIRMYEKGATYMEMAKELGVTKAYVSSKLAKTRQQGLIGRRYECTPH